MQVLRSIAAIILLTIAVSACANGPGKGGPETVYEPPVTVPADISVPRTFHFDPNSPSRTEDTGNIRYADLTYRFDGKYGALNAKTFFLDSLRKQGWTWLKKSTKVDDDSWSANWTKDHNRLVVRYFERQNSQAKQNRYSYVEIRLNPTRE